MAPAVLGIIPNLSTEFESVIALLAIDSSSSIGAYSSFMPGHQKFYIYPIIYKYIDLMYVVILELTEVVFHSVCFALYLLLYSFNPLKAHFL